MSDLLTRLRRRLAPPNGGPLADGQLLQQFLARHDEAAFAALVRRHGPLVLGVCRRVLGDAHSAEDAFQATFLVLVRRAPTLVGPKPLGPWLYGVALRTARALREQRRRRREEPLTADPLVPSTHLLDSDLREQLDAAVRRLPEKYRQAVVLCYLQGLTRREAADRLGCAEGTVGARLARACQRLRRRLAAHAPELVAGSLVATLAQAGAAVVPSKLVAATARAAAVFISQSLSAAVPPAVAELTQGVLRMFWVRRLATTACLLAAVLTLGIGMGVTFGPATPATAADPPKAPATPPTITAKKPALYIAILHDTEKWPIVVTEHGQGFAFKTSTALGIYLKRLRREPDAPDLVALAAHSDMKYAALIEILFVCQQAGFTHIDVRNWRGESKPLDLGQGLNSNAGLSGSIDLNERNFELGRSQPTPVGPTIPPVYREPAKVWFETITQRQLRGDWKVVGVLADGQSINQDDIDQNFITGLTFTDNIVTIHNPRPSTTLTYRIDPAHPPGWMDWQRRDANPDRTWPLNLIHGIYRLNGDRLDIAFFKSDDGRRPTDMTSIPARGSSRVVLNLVREQPEKTSRGATIGKVSAVDADHGLITFTLTGPIAGSQQSELQLFRMMPKPVFLGTVKILEVRDGVAVGRVKLLDAKVPALKGDLIGVVEPKK